MYQVLLTFILFASAMTVNKAVLQVLPPTLFAALRMGISGVLLLLFTGWKNPRYSWHYLKHDAVRLLGVSLFTTLIPAVLKAYSFKYLVSSKAAFLGSLDPFVTAFYVYLLWGETVSVQKIIGMLIGFMGTLILLITSSPTEVLKGGWWIFSYPELAALISMALGRFGWLIMQQLMRKERYSPFEVNGLSMFTSGALACLAAWYWGQFDQLPNVYSPKYGALLIYTIIFGNLIAYSMLAHLLKRYSATFISLAGFSIPLLVYVNGWLFLGEPLSWNFVIASAITFVGLVVFYYDEIHKRVWWKSTKK